MEKKEIQEKIILSTEKTSEEEFSNVLKIVAPGTNFRTALNSTLKAKKGALIAIENEYLPAIIDGGFRMNTRFTPQKLVELTKMDGAIILSKDMKKIVYANVLLTPSPRIKSEETGTRHKAAERTAKETGTLVVAISERKNEITLFYKEIKYHLRNTEELIRKANDRLQILEKQRELFDTATTKLTSMELRNYPSLEQGITVIQRGQFIQKVASVLQKNIIELGKEGTLLKIRAKEITKDIEKETDLVIKDYSLIGVKRSKPLLDDLSYEELLDDEHILKILGYEDKKPLVNAQGWRLLSKTSLHDSEIAVLINEAGSLGKSLHSSLDFYTKIFGIEKAQSLREEIGKIKMEELH